MLEQTRFKAKQQSKKRRLTLQGMTAANPTLTGVVPVTLKASPACFPTKHDARRFTLQCKTAQHGAKASSAGARLQIFACRHSAISYAACCKTTEGKAGAHSPGHDCSESGSDRRCPTGTEPLSSTSKTGLCTPVHTVRADRPEEVPCHVVIDTPGVSVQVSICGHDDWGDRRVITHICPALHRTMVWR